MCGCGLTSQPPKNQKSLNIMKKLLFILTALAVAGCTDKGHFEPAGSDALFSYTFAYDSTLGSSQTTNTKELYRVDGSYVKLSLEQAADANKNLLDYFAFMPEANRAECFMAQLDGDYASLDEVKLSTVLGLDYDDYCEVETGDVVDEQTTDGENGGKITVTEYESEAHPVYIVLCYENEDDDDYVGFAVRVVSVSKIITSDTHGIEVPPTSPFGDVTYKTSYGYEVYVETEYKAFNKKGWL